jgi:HPr kinase/phosphorylase
LIIRLEEWNQKVEYDRVGLHEQVFQILGVKIPQVVMPVRPGRNIAVLVEIAALNQRLKFKGHHAAKDFNQKLLKIIAKKKQERAAK